MASFDKNAELKEAENDKNAEFDKVLFDKNAEIEPGWFYTCWILSAKGKAMSTGSFRYRGRPPRQRSRLRRRFRWACTPVGSVDTSGMRGWVAACASMGEYDA